MRYWKRINTEGEITTVESYSHDLKVKGAIETTKQEFDSFIASLPTPEPAPAPRDLAHELDVLKERVTLIEQDKIAP